jgi:hypothetical protein
VEMASTTVQAAGKGGALPQPSRPTRHAGGCFGHLFLFILRPVQQHNVLCVWCGDMCYSMLDLCLPGGAVAAQPTAQSGRTLPPPSLLSTCFCVCGNCGPIYLHLKCPVLPRDHCLAEVCALVCLLVTRLQLMFGNFQSPCRLLYLESVPGTKSMCNRAVFCTCVNCRKCCYLQLRQVLPVVYETVSMSHLQP